MSRGHSLIRSLLVASLLMSPFVFLVWQYGGDVIGKAQSGSQYFPQTQHSVASPFYEFFSDHGGIKIFGYPITEKQTDLASGLWVQYFQRARMEYDPSAAKPGVRLAKLVSDMGYGQPPLAQNLIPLDTPYERYFASSGHTSSYAFLGFWDKYGREPIFGYPISEPEKINGRITQYFERVIMEWWPERQGDERVELVWVGDLYAERNVNPDWRKPAPLGAGMDGATATPVATELHVLSSVKDPVTRQSGSQTVYVLATNQTGNPVEGALVDITVYSNLSVHNYPDIPTSKYGIAAVTFPIEPDRPGQTVSIDIRVRYAGLVQTTQTSYMVWWGTP